MNRMTVPLDHVHAHPENANVMPAALLKKLADHIRVSGEYPAIIVRAHPTREGHYEILDGHHRVQALRELGHAEACCDVWQADDERARILLLTLNRLQGQDDPHKRSALLASLLNHERTAERLARLLPDHRDRIARLVELRAAPAALAPPRPPGEMPAAITFFVSADQRARIIAKLSALAVDRTAALLQALAIE